MPEKEELLTVREYAAETRQAPGSVYNQIWQDRLPIPFLRLNRKILFRRSDVERLKNNITK